MFRAPRDPLRQVRLSRDFCETLFPGMRTLSTNYNHCLVRGWLHFSTRKSRSGPHLLLKLLQKSFTLEATALTAAQNRNISKYQRDMRESGCFQHQWSLVWLTAIDKFFEICGHLFKSNEKEVLKTKCCTPSWFRQTQKIIVKILLLPFCVIFSALGYTIKTYLGTQLSFAIK